LVTLITIWGQVVKHPFDLGCVVLVLLISFFLSLQTKFKLFNYGKKNNYSETKSTNKNCKPNDKTTNKTYKIIGWSLVLLFCFNYKICEFIYNPESKTLINLNWALRMKFYSLIFLLSTYLIRNYHISIKLFFALLCADFVDRVLFNDASFHYSDLFIIFIVLKNDLNKYYRLLHIKAKRYNEK
jgi:hypothetical protein